MMLKGKRIVVTGANGALGKVAAETARQYGAKVALVDIKFDEDVKRAFGEDALHIIDLTSPEGTFAGLARIGKIDVVFNIAGGFAMGATAHDINREQWDAMFTINVSTLQNVLSGVVPQMLKRNRGAIINVGALSALGGKAGMSAYIAAKGAVMRLTEGLSDEVKHNGVNVNAVLPSIIDTPQNRLDMPDAEPTLWVSPSDLSEVLCFLGSDRARAIHGALIPVSGLV